MEAFRNSILGPKKSDESSRSVLKASPTSSSPHIFNYLQTSAPVPCEDNVFHYATIQYRFRWSFEQLYCISQIQTDEQKFLSFLKRATSQAHSANNICRKMPLPRPPPRQDPMPATQSPKAKAAFPSSPPIPPPPPIAANSKHNPRSQQEEQKQEARTRCRKLTQPAPRQQNR